MLMSLKLGEVEKKELTNLSVTLLIQNKRTSISHIHVVESIYYCSN